MLTCLFLLARTYKGAVIHVIPLTTTLGMLTLCSTTFVNTNNLLKRSISPSQQFSIKLSGPSIPMSAPGGLQSSGNQKCPSLLFHSRGKKNSCADQSEGMTRGMLPTERPQWTPSLTAMGPRERASHCPVTELTVQRRKHPSTVTMQPALLPRHWLGLAQHQQAKPNKRPTHIRSEKVHHSKPSSSSSSI